MIRLSQMNPEKLAKYLGGSPLSDEAWVDLIVRLESLRAINTNLLETGRAYSKTFCRDRIEEIDIMLEQVELLC